MSSKQVILITGSSTGFGRLFAEAFARKGYTVFATMREIRGKNAKNVAELHELAKTESLDLHTLEMDVTSEPSVEEAVQTVVSKAGRIDVAINNAGYAILGLAEAIPVDQAQRIMDTNFMGTVRVNRAVLPHMRRQRSGLLLHISSGLGRFVLPSMAFYCASKFALEALAETYHYELAGQGIDSVIMEPGAYKTSVFDNMQMVEDPDRSSTYGPMGEVPAKIGAALNATTANPKFVTEAALQIVETPAGQRKLRYRVSSGDLGIDAINAASAEAQARYLGAYGLLPGNLAASKQP